MKLTEFFREELDREVERSRKALEQVPDGQYQWKPHERSMIFGYLADMVATIPTWISMEVERDELDIAPAEGKGTKQAQKETKADLLKALDETAAGARSALEKTSDDHLMTKWKLLAGGERRNGVTALPVYSGDDQSLGAPPRTNDCLFATHGRKGSSSLWTVSRRTRFLAADYTDE